MIGYPTQDWMSRTLSLMFSVSDEEQEEYTVHFLKESDIEKFEFGSGNLALGEEDYLVLIGSSADNLIDSSVAKAKLKDVGKPENVYWDTRVESLALNFDKKVSISKKVKPTQPQILAREGKSILSWNGTLTAPTTAGLERELQRIMDRGEWGIAQANADGFVLNLQSTPNTIQWVTIGSSLEQGVIGGLDVPLVLEAVETATELVKISFEQAEFNTDNLDTLVTDYFIYHVVEGDRLVAFNYHLDTPTAPLDSIECEIQLNWSQFRDEDGEILII